MRQQFTIRFVVLSIMLVVAMTGALAQTFTIDGIMYLIYNDEVVVNDYSGPGGSVTIPGSVEYSGNTYTVTGIGQHAFHGCSGLTSIDIPDGVTSISDGVFRGCSGLTSIDIPDGVWNIGEYAFSGCGNLTSINIPDGVTSIGRETFYGCTSLIAIDLPARLETIGAGAFADCTRLESIKFPDNLYLKVIEDGYESSEDLGKGAFQGCTSLTSVDLPDGLEELPYAAFANCTGLKSVKLPSNLKVLGSGIPEWGTNNCMGVFNGCTSLTSIVLPESLEVIDPQTFAGCASLHSINLPAGLKEIGAFAFDGTDLSWIVSSMVLPVEVNDSYLADEFNNCNIVLLSDYIPGEMTIFHWDDVFYLAGMPENSSDVRCARSFSFSGSYGSHRLGISGGDGEDHLYTGNVPVYMTGCPSSCEMDLIGLSADVGSYDFSEVTFSFKSKDSLLEISEIKLEMPLSYTISKAPLVASVFPSSASITYGETCPEFNVTYDGFVNGEDESELSSRPTVSCNVWYGSRPDAGTYPVTVSGGAARNYEIEYVDGELIVEKAILAVEGDSYTITYGDELPEFEYDISGFVLYENEDDLDAVPTIIELNNPTARTYTLTISGGEARNYNFDYHPGTLTVLKATQSIAWGQDFTSGLRQGDLVEMTAATSSGLEVDYESTNTQVVDVVFIEGKPYLNCIADGSANIIATQLGNGNYEPAKAVTKRVNVGSGSGISETSSPSISCHPSPARDMLEVTGTLEEMSCAAYDLSGALVLTSRCTDGVTRLDVSRLATGTYVLVVTDSDGSVVSRLRFAKE